MKKNKMMRTASVLLVLTLLTVCVISGTFAKYVSEGNGTDTARVAKWGVEVTGNGTTFAKTYAKDDNKFSLDTNSVVSTANVVAPGTKGAMATMTLNGTPEVAVRVNYTGSFALDDNWSVDGVFYCPLVIKVKSAEGTTEIKQTADINTAAKFNDAVNAAITAYSKDYKAGTNLSTVGPDALTVTWEWPFDGNDTKDTKLGDAAAAQVTLAVKTTVTQID